MFSAAELNQSHDAVTWSVGLIWGGIRHLSVVHICRRSEGRIKILEENAWRVTNICGKKQRNVDLVFTESRIRVEPLFNCHGGRQWTTASSAIFISITTSHLISRRILLAKWKSAVDQTYCECWTLTLSQSGPHMTLDLVQSVAGPLAALQFGTDTIRLRPMNWSSV